MRFLVVAASLPASAVVHACPFLRSVSPLVRGRFFALPGSEQGPGEAEAEGVGQVEGKSDAEPGVFDFGLAGVPKQILDR